jgi:hypothetical protein
MVLKEIEHEGEKQTGLTQDRVQVVIAVIHIRVRCGEFPDWMLFQLSDSQTESRRTSLGIQQEIAQKIRKDLVIPQKIPNVCRDIAGIFVRQLAVLE